MNFLFSILVAVFFSSLFSGCQQASPEPARSYQGAGSKWTASIDASSFTLTKYSSAASNATADLTITGSVATNSTSLFKVLTVTSATGAGAPAVGSTSNALEIPQTAFFFSPFGSTGEPIVMVSAGSCPTASIEANWIIAKPRSDFTAPLTTTKDFFGSVVLTISGASSSLVTAGHQTITGAALGSGGGNMSFDSTTCSNGVQRIADGGGDFFDLYLTRSGMSVVKFSPSTGNQIIFGSPKQSAAVTQATIASTYSGLLFEDKAGGDTLSPVQLTIPSSGNSTGLVITNVVNNSLDNNGIVISNISSTVDSSSTQLPTGFFRGDVNPVNGSATNGKISCAYSTSGAVKIVSCTGYINDTGGDARRPFYVLARSR